MTSSIVADALVKTYPPDIRALDGLSLEVPAGIVFGLLGPNGAGKSTFVRVLTTLSRPDSGHAAVAGADVLREPSRARHRIGVVGQKRGADLEATARENLTLQGELYGLHGRALRQAVDTGLQRFDLAEVADRRVKTYSGGMARRLDVALGLIHRPRVLFLDEPTTGLDPAVRAELWSEIERLAREEGMTVLLTTHYLEEADRLASRLAIVDRGRVVVTGTPEELKRQLDGDRIDVELASDDVPRALLAVERMPAVRADGTAGAGLRLRAPDGGRAVPGVLAALAEQGIHPTALTVARPSLDDVYLRHTGRHFEVPAGARHAEPEGVAA